MDGKGFRGYNLASFKTFGISGGKPMSRFLSFVAGSVMGAAVGAAIALLVTPYSGEELRELAREAAFARREQLEARMRELKTTRKRSAAPEEEV
jgi:gas vesicle protein